MKLYLTILYFITFALFFVINITRAEVTKSEKSISSHQLNEIDTALYGPIDTTSNNGNGEFTSNCTSFNYVYLPTFFVPAPDPQFGDSAYAQRLTAPKPETLLTIEFLVYDEQNGTFGNNDIYITIYDDDGNGFPGALLALETLLAGTYPAYPGHALADFSDIELILFGDYHVAFSSSGVFGEDYENLITSGEAEGVLRSTACGHSGFEGWYTIIEHYGVDISFYFKVTTCKDVYTICGYQSCHYPATKTWSLPGSDGRTMLAQKFEATTESCRLDKVRARLIWPSGESSLPLYTYETRISVYSDSGGFPGLLLDSVTIGVSEYVAAGISQPGASNTLVADIYNDEILLGYDVWVVI